MKGQARPHGESHAAYTPLPSEPPTQVQTQTQQERDQFDTQSADVDPDDLVAAYLHNLDLQNRHRYSPRQEGNSTDIHTYQDETKRRNSDGDQDNTSLEMAAYGPESDFVTGIGMRSDSELMVGMNAPAKEERKGDKAALLAALIGLATLLIGTWLIVLLNHPDELGLFAAHPPLQSLAIVCFGLGILLLQPTSQPKTKARGLTRHQVVILGVGLPSIVIGTVLVFANKIVHQAKHFTTWHATFGLMAVVWMICQMLLGGLSVWSGGRAFGGGMKAKSVWKYHRVSGYLLFPLFLMTAALGGNYSSWTASVASVGTRVVVYTLAPIVALVGILFRIRVSKMNFRP
ncbi:hypothetical protein M0805_001622 [Coniferiporia weirii]|nr:hypothetical protein M0805_001622 [Coniferiporia weirii]